MALIFPVTTVRGDWVPQLERQSSHFDPVRGYVATYDYNGADQPSAIALWQDYCLNGIAATCTLEKDKAVVQAVDSTMEYTIDSWELHDNEEVRDLFSLPSFIAGVANTYAYGSQSFIDAFSNLRSYAESTSPTPVTTLQNDTILKAIYNGDSVTWAQLLNLYNAYKQGTTGYRHQQYVLKHKTNVSNRWTVNIADFGIDQIYTTAQLLTEVSDGGLWIFPLPTRLQYKLSVIPIPVMGQLSPDANGGYQWGWLKSGATEVTEARNRINIENEYVLELWNTAIYSLYQT